MAGEVVERGEDVGQPQDGAEEGDERLLLGLADDLLAEGEAVEEFGDLLGVLVVVLAVGLEEDDTSGVAVAEQGDRVVGLLFEVAEGDDVAVGLDRVEDAVGVSRPG